MYINTLITINFFTEIQVNVTELTSTKVKISWCLPYGGTYSVKLYIYHGCDVKYEDNMEWSEITLINIIPGKQYTATVVAQYYGGNRETGSRNFRTSLF